MSVVRKLIRKETQFESGYADHRAARLQIGTVQRPGETIEVQIGPSLLEARRAKSCLVAPESGDEVLCVLAPESVFVLAILEGHEASKTRIVADGDLELQAPKGRITLCSSKGVDLLSGGDVTMSSGELCVRATKGSVAVEELGFFGKLIQAEVAKIGLVAHEIDGMVTRLRQRAKRVFRFVEEIDQTRAGTVDIRAQNLATIRGENARLSARVLAKLDGEQIHIG